MDVSTDPDRAADWRWRVAVRCAAQGAMANGYSDPLLRRTITYMRCRQRATSAAGRRQVDASFPTISAARQIRFDRHDGRRTAIECRLLANYPLSVIAAKSSLPLAVIVCFCALFFDVLDRLDAQDFIRANVIGIRDGDADHALPQRAALLWLAFCGGPFLCDTLLRPGYACGYVDDFPQSDEYLERVQQSLLVRLVTLALSTGPLSSEDAKQILLRQVQQWQPTTNADAQQHDYTKNVAKFLERIGPQLKVGRGALRGDEDQRYEPVSGNSILPERESDADQSDTEEDAGADADDGEHIFTPGNFPDLDDPDYVAWLEAGLPIDVEDNADNQTLPAASPDLEERDR